MDKNKDNFVSKREMKDFFKDRVRLDIKFDDFNIFVAYCDKNNDDRISVSEFINSLKSHA